MLQFRHYNFKTTQSKHLTNYGAIKSYMHVAAQS